ncbi:metallopeptidase TldD-related protein [Archangium lipolyticum]|uniref:metallopeptidase TldD-related protein n=1 Tax=Archangium lipolyticum TaxID=2970465 RepID=UPI00214A0DE7|nr:metallopeptidase TldD-related protein [Archangium lipolyticum]
MRVSTSEAGMDPRALTDAARAELEAFTRRLPSITAELFLSAGRRLSLEYEVGTGSSTISQGESLSVAARVWEGERSGHAVLPLGGSEGLGRVLELAVRRMGTGSPPPPVVGELAGPASPPLAGLSSERMREQAARLTRMVVPPGVVVQAMVLARSETWTALLRGEGGFQEAAHEREEAFVRCETSRGAVVDAVASRRGDDWDLASLRARLAGDVEALEGPAGAVEPALPLVLRPAVAAPLVAALGWMLRGDVAASLPALARAVGKKPFPSVLCVEDVPLHPLGTRWRSADDEGTPTRPLRLIDEGRLQGFLHSAASAARLGVESNGRGLRFEDAPPAPSAVNLFVVPRGDALPEHYTELVARVETFTTMPRPGTVTLLAGGWEVRAGQRVRRVAPVDLSLPVLETFRALRGVGSDLTFFPTAEGCGTPTLFFPPLLGG